MVAACVASAPHRPQPNRTVASGSGLEPICKEPALPQWNNMLDVSSPCRPVPDGGNDLAALHSVGGLPAWIRNPRMLRVDMARFDCGGETGTIPGTERWEGPPDRTRQHKHRRTPSQTQPQHHGDQPRRSARSFRSHHHHYQPRLTRPLPASPPSVAPQHAARDELDLNSAGGGMREIPSWTPISGPPPPAQSPVMPWAGSSRYRAPLEPRGDSASSVNTGQSAIRAATLPV